MKGDLVFKIGTLCSFFLIGLEYISEHIVSGTVLNYFVGVIIIIIFTSVLYCLYILFSYKEIVFKITKNHIYCINSSQYHIIITRISVFNIDDIPDNKGQYPGDDRWMEINTKINNKYCNPDISEDCYFYHLGCLAKSTMKFYIYDKKTVNKPKYIMIDYILTDKKEILNTEEYMHNNIKYHKYNITRKLTFFEKRAIKKQK